MKALLVQCALSASRTKGTYLRDKYHRLAARRGKKKAAIAIGHKILVMVYHILKKEVGYQELGADYLDKRNLERVKTYHINKLIGLGFNVSVKADAA